MSRIGQWVVCLPFRLHGPVLVVEPFDFFASRSVEAKFAPVLLKYLLQIGWDHVSQFVSTKDVFP